MMDLLLGGSAPAPEALPRDIYGQMKQGGVA